MSPRTLTLFLLISLRLSLSLSISVPSYTCCVATTIGNCHLLDGCGRTDRLLLCTILGCCCRSDEFLFITLDGLWVIRFRSQILKDSCKFWTENARGKRLWAGNALERQSVGWECASAAICGLGVCQRVNLWVHSALERQSVGWQCARAVICVQRTCDMLPDCFGRYSNHLSI